MLPFLHKDVTIAQQLGCSLGILRECLQVIHVPQYQENIYRLSSQSSHARFIWVELVEKKHSSYQSIQPFIELNIYNRLLLLISWKYFHHITCTISILIKHLGAPYLLIYHQGTRYVQVPTSLSLKASITPVMILSLSHWWRKLHTYSWYTLAWCMVSLLFLHLSFPKNISGLMILML